MQSDRINDGLSKLLWNFETEFMKFSKYQALCRYAVTHDFRIGYSHFQRLQPNITKEIKSIWRCNGNIYSTTKNLKWKILGIWPTINSCGVCLWYIDGLILIIFTAWSIAWTQTDVGSFTLKSKECTMRWSLLIKDYAKPFCVCTWAIGCSIEIPTNIQ